MAEMNRREEFLEGLRKAREQKVTDQFRDEWPKVDQVVTEMEVEIKTRVLNDEPINKDYCVFYRPDQDILLETFKRMQADVERYGYYCALIQDCQGTYLKIFWDKK